MPQPMNDLKRPKFPGEGKKIRAALDHWWNLQPPESCKAFVEWYESATPDSRKAWFKDIRVTNLPLLYGDPNAKARTDQYNQKFGPTRPKRPKGAPSTNPFGLNTPTESRPDSWYFGANIAGDWLEAACRFSQGATPLKIALALQHEAMFLGSPVDIELKSGKGSGKSRIREQFGVSGSGYNKAAERLRSAGLTYFPDLGGRKRNRYTILGPYIGFDHLDWVHYLDGLPVHRAQVVDELDEEAESKADKPAPTFPSPSEALVIQPIRDVLRVGSQELTTYPLENSRAKRIVLDGEPYYPPYHKFLTTGEFLTDAEIEKIGMRLTQ